MADKTDGSLAFWKDKFWSVQRSPWHLRAPHAQLVANAAKLLIKGARVLVPLCGKSVDLKWLYESGYNVVGVEGTQEAIEEFFRDTGLEHTSGPFGDAGLIYQTPDKRLTILRANFFTLEHPDYVNSFDSVWDRASIVAILPEHRQFYVASIKRLVKPEFKCLLITTEYDQSKVDGPPFSVTLDDILRLYGDWTTINRVESKDLPPDTNEYINEKFILANAKLSEGVYMIKNKRKIDHK